MLNGNEIIDNINNVDGFFKLPRIDKNILDGIYIDIEEHVNKQLSIM